MHINMPKGQIGHLTFNTRRGMGTGGCSHIGLVSESANASNFMRGATDYHIVPNEVVVTLFSKLLVDTYL